MATSLQELFELDPTIGDPVLVFGDDKVVQRQTFLQREIAGRDECATHYKYDKCEYHRALTPFTGRGGRSVSIHPPNDSVEMIQVATTRTNIPLTAEQMHAVRAVGLGSDNSARQVEKIRRQARLSHALTREKVVAMVLEGTLTIDNSTFPGGTTVTGVSISFTPTTLAVSASWNTAGTNIRGDVENWQADIEEASGMMIGGVLYNETVAVMLGKNDTAAGYVNSVLPSRTEGFYTTNPAALRGYGGVENWWKYTGTYKPRGGSNTRFLSDNAIIALPEAHKELLVLVEGEGDIPSGASVMARAGRIIPTPGEGPDKTLGYSEYIIETKDPAGIKFVAQDTFIVVNKFPTAFGREANVTS